MILLAFIKQVKEEGYSVKDFFGSLQAWFQKMWALFFSVVNIGAD
jgi:hypothetical protein